MVSLTSRLALAASILLAGLESAGAFDLQGHRGARGLFPENSLPGFAAALTIGVTTLELDTAITKDGVVVVSHDRRLNSAIARDQNGQWVPKPGPMISALSLSELSRYDIGRIAPGSRYQKRFPDQKAIDGVAIPTLEAVIALVRQAGNDRVRFNIETKISPAHADETLAPEAFVEAVLAVIGKHGIQSRTTIQSFDWRSLKAVHRSAPKLSTGCLSAERRWLDNIQRGRPGASPWTAGFDIDDAASLPELVKRAGCTAWSAYHRDLDAGAIAEAKKLGLQVLAWTVNKPERMATLIDWGIDGIITDYPDRLRQVLLDKGLKPPEPSPVAWKR